jgi:hypothetical protein
MGQTPEEAKASVRAFVLTELVGEPDLELGDDEGIFSSGLSDSFSAVRLLAFLGSRFGVPPEGVGIEDLDTVAKCLKLIDRRAG